MRLQDPTILLSIFQPEHILGTFLMADPSGKGGGIGVLIILAGLIAVLFGIIYAFKRVFSSNGRIRRTEFGVSFILANLVSSIIWNIQIATVPDLRYGYGNVDTNTLLICFIFYIPLAIIMLQQSRKRCHDLGNSGWYAFIPFYNPLFLIFASGDVGINQYGRNPKDRQVNNTSNFDSSLPPQSSFNKDSYEGDNNIGTNSNWDDKNQLNDSGNKIEELSKLKKMLDEGLINAAEFNLLKKNILNVNDQQSSNTESGDYPITKNDILKESSPPTETKKSKEEFPARYFFIVAGFLIIVIAAVFYYQFTKDSKTQNSNSSITVDNKTVAIDTTKTVTVDTTRSVQSSPQTIETNNIDEVKKGIIEKYLKAQDNRNFEEFSQYYAPNIRRNWEIYNPTLAQIQTAIYHLWAVTSSSSQIINGMEMANDSTVKADITNTYITRKKSITKQIEYYIYFVFDSNNQITETYGYEKSLTQNNNDSLNTTSSNSSLSANNSQQQDVKRDPDSRKDFANVFWKRQYTLFDFSTDEPIFPVNTNGIITYKIYYSSNEDPNPSYSEFTVDQLENLRAYKFKNEQNCLIFCNSKKSGK